MIDLSKLPVMAQRQDSLTDQLEDLIQVATRLGMYDAADYLRRKVPTAGRWEEALADGRFRDSLRVKPEPNMWFIVGYVNEVGRVTISSKHGRADLALDRARKESADYMARHSGAVIAGVEPSREYKAYRTLFQVFESERPRSWPRLGASVALSDLQEVVEDM